VTEDAELLNQAKLYERPLFVVNGRRADGRVALVQLVEAGLKKAGIKPPALPEAAPARMIAGPGGGAPQPMIMGLSTPQRFHLEARDDSWAAAVEKQLVPLVERDLRAVDQGMAVAVECKSMFCRLRVRSAKSGPAGAAFVKQVYGAELLPGVSGAETQGYLRLRDGREMVTADDSIARVRSRRAGVLFSLRTGRVKPEADLPVGKLPHE
jgi:hypothetical protein